MIILKETATPSFLVLPQKLTEQRKSPSSTLAFMSQSPPRLSHATSAHFSLNGHDVATQSGGLTRAFSAPPSLLFSNIPLLKSFSDSRCHGVTNYVTRSSLGSLYSSSVTNYEVWVMDMPFAQCFGKGGSSGKEVLHCYLSLSA
ncbi:hypothetical protein L195_g046434 [Trifolium pratense]|uniref:Uncharacterized protein n=1 Tax=Trifolium pratense TaxID=57577 RepID=A0A2K3MHQ5_TRIPR|nr:hypothetical protein L195_g046434 [Trifolium pratense]